MALEWPSSSIKNAFFITCVSTAFQITGFILPMWFCINGVTYMGLFMVSVCSDGLGSDCKITMYDDIDVDAADKTVRVVFVFLKILAAVAGLSCGLMLTGGVLNLLTAGLQKYKGKPRYVIACICHFVAALLNGGVCVFLLTNFIPSYIYFVQESGAKDLPWSPILFGIGGMLSVVSFLFLCRGLCHWQGNITPDHVGRVMEMKA